MFPIPFDMVGDDEGLVGQQSSIHKKECPIYEELEGLCPWMVRNP